MDELPDLPALIQFRLMRIAHRRAALAALVWALAGCSQQGPGQAGDPQAGLPRAAADSPLFVDYPDLDQRIVRVDPRSGTDRATYYPDTWSAEARVVRDFAVDQKQLYALLGSRRDPDDPRLFVVDLDSGKLLRTLQLAASPQLLSWGCGGGLLVGHATPPAGPAGRLTVLSARSPRRVLRVVPLAGALQAMVSLGQRVYALERQQRERGESLISTSALVEIDPAAGRVLRRKALPPGSTLLAPGPDGRLAVAHGSGAGTLATDGTLSLVDRGSLRVARRLKLRMVVQGLAHGRGLLLMHLLSESGETWLEALGRDQQTVFSVQPDPLLQPRPLVVGDLLYLVPRQGTHLLRVDLARREVLPRLRLARPCGLEDRPARIRARVVCDED